MSTCAVCQLDNGLVINIIVAEPFHSCPQNGCQLVLIEDGVLCDIGWHWTGTEFVNPNPSNPSDT